MITINYQKPLEAKVIVDLEALDVGPQEGRRAGWRQ